MKRKNNKLEKLKSAGKLEKRSIPANKAVSSVNYSDIPAKFHGLTEKQVLFCVNYVGKYHFASAAKIAGYNSAITERAVFNSEGVKELCVWLQSERDKEPIPTRQELAKLLLSRIYDPNEKHTPRNLTDMLKLADEMLGYKAEHDGKFMQIIALPDTYYKNFGLPKIEDISDADVLSENTENSTNSVEPTKELTTAKTKE